MGSLADGSNAGRGGILQTKYYCKLDKSSMNMNVVMELNSRKEPCNSRRIPLRYVLLIDVSASMKKQIGKQDITLLQRVQTFAELVARKVDDTDWLSIVTFSDDAKIDFPMQQMLRQNRQSAREEIQKLQTRRCTNLEAGLIKALKAIRRAPKINGPCRDCIILFTDGVANLGELKSEKLIRKYRKMQKKMKRTSCIPVSALTIGGYRPDLLIEIARKLGSESFYWLNDEYDFETDMLVPIFLREQTSISDVDIRISAISNCYFEPVNMRAKYLTGVSVNKVEIKDNKKSRKIKSPTILNFFIHSLPDEKNLAFNLQVSDLQDLSDDRVADLTIRYLDSNLSLQTIQDHIFLSTIPLNTSLRQNLNAEGVMISDEAQLSNCCAYLMLDNCIGTSWTDAQDAIVKIAEEKYKSISIGCIAEAKIKLKENPQHLLEQACREMDALKLEVSSILSQDGDRAARVAILHKEWTERIAQAQVTLQTADGRSFSILACMESSIETESPVGGGVFKGEQPFVNEAMKSKLAEEKENLESVRRLNTKGNIDINVVKEKADKAVPVGDIETMHSCYEDLKAVKLFGTVDEEYLRYLDEEIKHRRQLEKTKKDLETAVENEDVASVSQLILKLEELKKNGSLSFHNGDEEAIKQAKVFRAAQTEKEEAMRKDVQECLPLLELAMLPCNLDQLSLGIDAMQRMLPKLKIHNMHEEYEGILNQAICNRDTLKEKKQQILNDIQRLSADLKLPPTPENAHTLNAALEKLKALKIEAEGYDVFTSINEAELYQVTNSLEQLEDNAEKAAKLRAKLDKAIQSRDFEKLTQALNRAKKTPLIKSDELLEAKKLVEFLNPENRQGALANAIEDEDIEMIEKALLEMKEANVENVSLVKTADDAIHNLRKDVRRKDRQQRREGRAAEKRKNALDQLNATLTEATEAHDLAGLEKAVNNLDIGDFTDEDVEAAVEARAVLKELRISYIRKRLNKGIKKRDAEILENAVMGARYWSLEQHVKKEYEEAEALMNYLLEMVKLRKEIAKMSRATISEVHSYSAPPKVVKVVMQAIFVILGEDLKGLTWMKLQTLMRTLGNNSMTKRIIRFRIDKLPSQRAEKATKLIKGLKLDEVEVVSKVAATLYAWARFVLTEVDQLADQQKRAAQDSKDQHDKEEVALYENEISEPENISPQNATDSDDSSDSGQDD